jgi:hypothetical protein
MGGEFVTPQPEPVPKEREIPRFLRSRHANKVGQYRPEPLVGRGTNTDITRYWMTQNHL